MRVALVTHSLEGGGAQQVTRGWADALASSGHEVVVLLLDASPPAASTRVWAASALTSRPGRSIPGRILALRRTVRRGGIDVVVGVQTYPNLLALVALTGRRMRPQVVISEHNVPSIYLRDGPRAYRAQLLLARLLYRRADRAVAVSHAVAADLLTNFAIRQEQAAVVLNGIFDGAASAPPRPRTRRIHLLVPARLARQKRPWKAAAVARALALDGHAVKLSFVGDPSERADEPGAGETEGIEVERLGWREDWASLADENTVVLLASGVEGLGNVLIEAAAHGIPSVASSTALGVGDAVIPGVTGVLAVSDTDSSFASAVLRAVELPRRRAPEGWLQQFSTPVVAETLQELLEPTRRG